LSINTVEAFLHKLGNDKPILEAFVENKEAVLDKCPLSDEERRQILDWDLHAIVDSGVSPMALMFGYVAANGGPDVARDEYIRILKGPKQSDETKKGTSCNG